MNEQFDQLVSYVKQQLDRGVTEEHLRQILHQYNWTPELVDRAFWSAQLPVAPAYQQTPTTVDHAENYQSQAVAQPQTWDQQVQSQTQNSFNQPIANTPTTAEPSKYRVFRSLQDTLQAIKNNALIFLLSIAISYAVAVASFFLVLFITSRLFYGQYGLYFASTAKLLTVLFSSLVLYTAWYSFAYAFILAASSLALHDGKERRKGSVGTILSNSFARTKRVVGANMLFALVSFWPVVLIIFLPIILLFSGHTSSSTSLLLIPVAVLAGLIWNIIAMTRFALVPYVALFEPTVPVRQTLGRSKLLLQNGGQWFLVKGALLILAIAIVIALATGQNLQQITRNGSILTNIALIVLSILINGSLVMLYHNRRAIKG